jgi:type II secretory pathway component GspD/PulD (secretin)
MGHVFQFIRRLFNPEQGLRFRKAGLAGLCAAAFAVSAVWAQEVAVPAQSAPGGVVPAVGPNGKPVVIAAPPAGAQPGGAQPGAKPGEQKPGEAKPGDQKAAQPGAAPAVTQRPAKPANEPNPEELKARPDADGKVRFNFTGQPWPAVLEWLATISNMSLDWQELPGDFLNLTTRQPYTVEEARDLINRHLFARGFTITTDGEVLSVMNLKTLDPGRVPRVTPEELVKRQPYDFVKVSFPLKWMMAEDAAEELKPMISPNGKMTPLKSTNRLEIMDAVINLREISGLLKEEQSTNGQDRLVREFQLQHARASDVVDQLTELLGLEKKQTGPKTPQQLQMEQQQAMMRMQQQQQMQQQGGAKPPKAKGEEPVNLVANTRQNSVLANAPADKMAVIERAVQLMDVPSTGAESLIANLNRMQVYRLGELDPEPFAKTLTDMGLLDPTTRLEVDKRNKSIVVFAPLADHMVIRQLIDRLDRTGRTFEVIKLHRLEADQVAGTVEFMINGPQEDDQSKRRSYYYGFGYYMQDQEQSKSNDKFRVDADVENNQLILWANPVEMEEVHKLLAKLGEVVVPGANTSTVRVLNLQPGEDTAAALERLRRMWPMLAPNPLLMPTAPNSNQQESTPAAPQERQIPHNEEARAADPIQRSSLPAKAPPVAASEPKTAASQRVVAGDGDNRPAPTPIAVPAVLHKASREESESTTTPIEPRSLPKADGNSGPTVLNRNDPDGRSANAPGVSRGAKVGSGNRQAATQEPPPVTVSISPDGRLIITSSDTRALDIFEEMVNQVAPARQDFKVFYLKHASALSVSLNLEEYFQIDKKKDNDNNRRPYYYYWDEFGSQSKKDETRRLSKRRELTFIYDLDTNSILVTGADASQLQVIEELVKIYDRIEPADSRMARMTKVFTLRWSKAKVVGEAVKDVYRDLLSTNDKALQQGEQDKNNKRAENVYIFGSDEPTDPRGTQVKFKGKLSVGIDDLSNTLVVSTEGENLMNNVASMIESLDLAAKPALTRVEVMQVKGTMTSADVRKALARALIEQQRAQQQNGPQQAPNGQPTPNGQGQVQPNQQNGPNGQQ